MDMFFSILLSYNKCSIFATPCQWIDFLNITEKKSERKFGREPEVVITDKIYDKTKEFRDVVSYDA